MRLGVLLLVTFSLNAEPIPLQISGKSAPPPIQEARQFLALVCPAEAIGTDSTFPGLQVCRGCPGAQADSGMVPLVIEAIHYGRFTGPGEEQALLATSGCQPHSLNWGGSLLFASRAGKWRYVRYLPGVIASDCAVIPWAGGRSALACYREESHQSVVQRVLFTLDLSRPEGHMERRSLMVVDTMPTCGLNYSDGHDETIYPMRKAEFERILVDRERATVTVSLWFGKRAITREQARECATLDRPHRLPRPEVVPVTRKYELTFQFEGDALKPSPVSVGVWNSLEEAGAFDR